MPWQRGDVAKARFHDTGRWNKVFIKPMGFYYGDYYLCDGLDCNNEIRKGELHGGGNGLHFCLNCLVPVELPF